MKKEPQEAGGEGTASSEQPRTRMLDKIKLPSVNVLPKRFTFGKKEQVSSFIKASVKLGRAK